MKNDIVVSRLDALNHCDAKKHRHAMYSVDFQPPQGDRVATAGGDWQVKIWSHITPSTAVDPSTSTTHLLSTLTAHAGSVNVVRWSKDGKYLASGSDDRTILIHSLNLTSSGNSSNVFGSSAASLPNKEHWLRCFTCTGHSMDVLDVDWSPNGVVASASVDNTVMIWDVAGAVSEPSGGGGERRKSSLLSPVRVLRGHKSFVKGVSFDPMGEFLASCGDDNQLLVWGVTSWSPQAANYSISPPPVAITSVFVDSSTNKSAAVSSSGRSLFRRLSWAPDGSSLALSSTFKSCKPIASVLKRGSSDNAMEWKSIANLVGHSADTAVVRFAPILLENATPQEPQSPSMQGCCLVAVGDTSGLVSVWMSTLLAPILVLRDIFEGGVSDLSWTIQEEFCMLIVTSFDGRIATVELPMGWVGRPFSDEMMKQHIVNLYGDGYQEKQKGLVRAQQQTLVGGGSHRPIIEDPAILQLLQSPQTSNSGVATVAEPRSKEAPSNSSLPAALAASAVNSSNSTQPLTSDDVLKLQKKSKTKDGKKRICPVSVDPGNGTAMLPNASSASNLRSLELPSSATTNAFSSSSVRPAASGNFGRSQQNFNQSERAIMTIFSSNSIQAQLPSYLQRIQRAEANNKTNAKKAAGGEELKLTEFSNVVKRYLGHHSPQTVAAASSLPLDLLDEADRKETKPRGAWTLIAKPQLLDKKSAFAAAYTKLVLVYSDEGQLPFSASAPSDSSTAAADASTDKKVWETTIVGEMTSVCGIEVCSTDVELLGFVLYATADGSCGILSLGNGQRISPTFVVGGPVLFTDIEMPSNDHVYFMTCTYCGGISIWKSDPLTSKEASFFLSGLSLQLMLSTQVDSIVQSMRYRNLTSALANPAAQSSNVDVILRRCELVISGNAVTPRVLLQSSGSAAGEYQYFLFNTAAQTWQRCVDARYNRSRLFSCAVDRTPHYDRSKKICVETLGHMESELSVLNGSNLSRLLSNSSRFGQTADDVLVTASHLEDKINFLRFNGDKIESCDGIMKQYLAYWFKVAKVDTIRAAINDMLAKMKKEKEDAEHVGGEGEGTEVLLRTVVVPLLAEIGSSCAEKSSLQSLAIELKEMLQ